MGELDDKKPEDAKPEEQPPKEASDQQDPPEKIKETEPLPQPPQDIVLTVFMHCEGCARKVRRCLKGFQGVESVETDCRTHRVVVKGEKADPVKVLDRLQKKSHRQVELISPIPEPPAAKPEPKPEPLEKPKAEDRKPEVTTVVLKVHMHCEACAQEIKRRIHRMKGVESVDPDLKSSQVTVKGAIDPAALVEYVHRRTGKHAAIVKQEPEITAEISTELDAPPKEEVKEEKKGDAGEQKVEEESKVEEKVVEGGDGEAAAEEGPKVVEVEVEVKKKEYQYYPQRYVMEMYPYYEYPVDVGYPAAAVAYPPQMFSEENPNACSVM